jgi:F5/8 type C domain
MKKIPRVDNRLSNKINVLLTENGGQVVSCSNQYNQTSWGAQNLIDGKLDSGHGYASKNRNAAEIVFAIPKTETITQLCFNPYTVESPETWAKLVKVEVSTQAPEKGFVPVGEFTLHNRRSKEQQAPLPDQCFDIAPTQARYIKLHLLSNHGGNYIEMGEFKAYSAVK